MENIHGVEILKNAGHNIITVRLHLYMNTLLDLCCYSLFCSVIVQPLRLIMEVVFFVIYSYDSIGIKLSCNISIVFAQF